MGARFQATRAEEYGEIAREAERLLEHVARETEDRDFMYAELEELEHDLNNLMRWADQVRGRDYVASPQAQPVCAHLQGCENSLSVLLEPAAEAQTAGR